jgi:hypothetical protein
VLAKGSTGRLLAKKSLKHSVGAMSLSSPTYQRIVKPLAVDGWPVFNVKSDGHKKARLVAQGFSQVEGIDFFSPVVCFESVQLILALSALEDYYCVSVDVRNAYLYGKLDKEIHMRQPKGFKARG